MSAQITVGAGTQDYSASVANSTDAVVTWQVNGIPGGNATVGTITSAGVFTAPTTLPAAASETITAVTDADSTVTASSIVTLAAAGSGGATASSTAPSSHGGGGGGLGFWSLLLLTAAVCGRAVALRIPRA
ncbi:MAG: hypothetical protein WDM77_19100 [Steroidobacteraceae bacterium]